MEKYYIEELSDQELIDIFTVNRNKDIGFKHMDYSLYFTTDGSFIYIHDIDDLDYDIIEENGFYSLRYYYNDFSVFIETFKKLETLLGEELYVSDSYNDSEISIRKLELDYIKRDD